MSDCQIKNVCTRSCHDVHEDVLTKYGLHAFDTFYGLYECSCSPFVHIVNFSLNSRFDDSLTK